MLHSLANVEKARGTRTISQCYFYFNPQYSQPDPPHVNHVFFVK